MSARPTYDKDLLLKLKMDHPDWTDGMVADALNVDNRSKGLPATVSASTVQSAVYRNKTHWAARGFTLPKVPRRSQYIRALMQLRGYRHLSSEENARSVPLKRLRYCERLSLGLPVPPVEESKARSWEAEMRKGKTVVDLQDGRAYVRAAYWYELDADGELIDLIAQAAPEDPSIVGLVPNLEDSLEQAIWERSGRTEAAKRRLIAELRTTQLTELLDVEIANDQQATVETDERVENGSHAG
jgi:hypothetical protein